MRLSHFCVNYLNLTVTYVLYIILDNIILILQLNQRSINYVKLYNIKTYTLVPFSVIIHACISCHVICQYSMS